MVSGEFHCVCLAGLRCWSASKAPTTPIGGRRLRTSTRCSITGSKHQLCFASGRPVTLSSSCQLPQRAIFGGPRRLANLRLSNALRLAERSRRRSNCRFFGSLRFSGLHRCSSFTGQQALYAYTVNVLSLVLTQHFFQSKDFEALLRSCFARLHAFAGFVSLFHFVELLNVC
jgi:hypothetical protein